MPLPRTPYGTAGKCEVCKETVTWRSTGWYHHLPKDGHVAVVVDISTIKLPDPKEPPVPIDARQIDTNTNRGRIEIAYTTDADARNNFEDAIKERFAEVGKKVEVHTTDPGYYFLVTYKVVPNETKESLMSNAFPMLDTFNYDVAVGKYFITRAMFDSLGNEGLQTFIRELRRRYKEKGSTISVYAVPDNGGVQLSWLPARPGSEGMVYNYANPPHSLSAPARAILSAELEWPSVRGHNPEVNDTYEPSEIEKFVEKYRSSFDRDEGAVAMPLEIWESFGAQTVGDVEDLFMDAIAQLGRNVIVSTHSVAGGFDIRWVVAPEISKGEGTTGHAIDPNGVDHPSHYNSHPSGVECIDIIEHMTHNTGAAVKYLWRAGLKTIEGDPLEVRIKDTKKAVWYLQRELARLEKEQKDG